MKRVREKMCSGELNRLGVVCGREGLRGTETREKQTFKSNEST